MLLILKFESLGQTAYGQFSIAQIHLNILLLITDNISKLKQSLFSPHEKFLSPVILLMNDVPPGFQRRTLGALWDFSLSLTHHEK